MQVTGEAGELPHRLGRQIRRHRHEVAPRPDVDARRKQIDLLQLRRSRRARRCLSFAFICLLQLELSAGSRAAKISHSLEQGRQRRH